MRLRNTLSGKVEEFVPLRDGEVSMYNCGPTVYKPQHIGNYRAYMMADLLRRTFEYLGYRVTQIVNITDVGHMTEDDVADARGEDKLQKEAQRRRIDPWQIAREEEEGYHRDLETLRIRKAERYPRATDHIKEMIAIIETLIEKGHAYVAEATSTFPSRASPNTAGSPETRSSISRRARPGASRSARRNATRTTSRSGSTTPSTS